MQNYGKIIDGANDLIKMGKELYGQIKPLKESLLELWKQVKEFGEELTQNNVTVVNVELLKKDNMLAIIHKHIPVGDANEAVAMIEKPANEDYTYLYVAFAKNQELLPKESNSYITIKCDYIARDVKELFNNDKLIIIK